MRVRNLLPSLSLLTALPVFAAELHLPVTTDPALQSRLFAMEPDIVTPIGIAVDRQNRVFVIESHTHQAKPNYPGPKQDRVKLFLDSDRDGKPDQITVFADGFRHAMNLAFSPRDELYLVHRNGVIVLHDRDGDGVCESQTKVLELQTPANYPHNGLGGIAFSEDGWLYIGMGENVGAPYMLMSSHGSSHSGGGEGGNIFRCRPDGRHLQLVATGFWNAFALEFDRAGHLFCVDNDPDARPPCRLLHVVTGGDFGYKFRYGRSGLHPYVCLDGELPGTLPMVAGTGEAPSGLLDADRAGLPQKYQGTLLVTSWGDHAVEMYRPRPVGASFHAEREIVVQGDVRFRPVGIAAGPDGIIYITDWVDRDYSVHRKGRIWRLSAGSGVSLTRAAEGIPKPPAAAKRMERLQSAGSPKDYGELVKALSDTDPFIRSAVLSSLAKPVFRSRVLKDLDHRSSQVRLGALLALRRAKYDEPIPVLKRLLGDPDAQVRRMALIWTGEASLTSLAADIDRALSGSDPSAALFHTWLATAELLSSPGEKVSLDTPQKLLERFLGEETNPAQLRARAVTLLPDANSGRTVELLGRLLQDANALLQTESVRTLSQSSHSNAVSLLKWIALDTKRPPDLRAEAILGLAHSPAEVVVALVQLLDDPAGVVQVETIRALRNLPALDEVRATLLRKYETACQQANPALAEQLHLALHPPGISRSRVETGKLKRPASDKEWRAELQPDGDPVRGRRVFFHPMVGCAKCHRIGGRGGQIGPDLSTVGRSSNRAKLIDSILKPSEDIAPQFVTWMVESKAGQSHSGLLAHRGPTGSMALTTTEAKTITMASGDIASAQTSAVSLMPEGLENGLTVQDFCDLLTYLLSLR